MLDQEIFFHNNLCCGYNWNDFVMGSCVYEYVLDQLEVPDYVLVDVYLNSQDLNLEITLEDVRQYANEDWFVHFLRQTDIHYQVA